MKNLANRLLIILALTSILLTALYGAAFAQSQVINPDLAPVCGINMILVLDESGSIQNAGAIGDVRAAAGAFATALAGTGSELAIVEFNTRARTPIGYTPVTAASLASVFLPYINATGGGETYNPGPYPTLERGTNWDDAMDEIAALNSGELAPLVVFVTDGNPTFYNLDKPGDPASTPPFFIPGIGGQGSSTDATTIARAIEGANTVKTQGSHMLAVGVGDALAIPSFQTNLVSIAGPDVFNGTGTFDVTTDDVTLVSDFDDLAMALRDIAYALCAPSLTVTKLVDQGAGYAPAPGWEFSAEVESPVPGGTDYFWLLPDDTASPGDLVSEVTDENGTLTFQWETNTPVNSKITVSETSQPGFEFVSVSCMVKSLDNPTPVPLTIDISGSSFSATLGTNDIATCQVRNRQLPPEITVVKENDADEDSAYSDTETLASLPPATVSYRVRITNNSLSAAEITAIGDDTHDISGSSCAALLGTTIGGGQTLTCFFTADFIEDNQTVTNIFSVTAENGSGSDSDSDDSTVIVPDDPASIEVTKTADPDLVTEPGDNVTFTVTVENTSTVDSVELDLISDDEDNSGSVDSTYDPAVICDKTLLDPGEIATCSFSHFVGGNAGDVIIDQVTVDATDDDGQPLSDSDTAVVTVQDRVVRPADIRVDKTNDADGDSAFSDNEAAPAGGALVTFKVQIFNQGIESFTIDQISDDHHGADGALTTASAFAPACADVIGTVLAGSQNLVCYFDGTIIDDDNASEVNEVTVTVSDDENNSTSGSDTSTVTTPDVLPQIRMLKTANPTAVPETGGNVTFTIEIFNLSAEALTLTSLSDSVFGDLNGKGSCSVPQALAAAGDPGDSYTCSFSEFLSGQAGTTHVNLAGAAAQDDDGNSTSAEDDAEVGFNNVPSSIEVTKTANPDLVLEPGDVVTFTVVIENTSAVDTVELDLISDDEDNDGAVDTTYDPALICDKTSLAPGEIATCSFSHLVSGNGGDLITDEVTVDGTDDDGDAVTDSDTAVVTVLDRQIGPNDLSVEKTNDANGDLAFSDNEQAPTGGSLVVFKLEISNLGVEAVTIDAILDDHHGSNAALTTTSSFAPACADVLGAALLPSTTVTCYFDGTIIDDDNQSEVNEAEVSVSDDEGNSVSDSDTSTVTTPDVLPDISLLKTADPTSVPETGGNVTFTITVTNNSSEAATLDSLVDNVFGDLNGKGTCSVPQALAAAGNPDDSYSCTFSEFLSGQAGTMHVNLATGTASDDDGNSSSAEDEAEVDFEDVLPDISLLKTADPTSIPEPGGNVLFTIEVSNLGSEPVTLTSLIDNVFGDLNGKGTCSVPQPLAAAGDPGDSYTCSFSEFIAGDYGDPEHEDTLVAVAVDDDGNSDTAADDALVAISNVPSSIEVLKTADKFEVFEPGEVVTFNGTVINTSLVDTVTIQSVVDSIFGDISAYCDQALPAVLLPGEALNCEFTSFIGGSAGDSHTNVVVAAGVDDDGEPVEDEDDETIIVIPPPFCPRTIGYWKNHAGFGPQDDMVTPLLPLWLGDAGGPKSLLVDSAAIAVDVLNQNVYGKGNNGITKLYAQLLGTKLNLAAGSDDSDIGGGMTISEAVAIADAFLATYNWEDWKNLSKSEQKQVLQWKDLFDAYNNRRYTECSDNLPPGPGPTAAGQ